MQWLLAVRETVVIKPSRLNIVAQGQGRRHGSESGGGDNFASGASQKFLTPPLFGQWEGQNIA